VSRFEEPSDLTEYLYLNDKKECELFVYNTYQRAARTVMITPNKDWGGVGIIGCQILHGLLTRIPKHSPAQA
jgi:hypothetical protein